MPYDQLQHHRQVHARPAYTIEQFGADFGIGRSKTYEEIKAKRLRAFKAGGRTLIAGEDAIAWRDSYRTGAVTP
jgi:hypothetical protein